MFEYIILKEIIHDYWLSKNRLAIHEWLKQLIIIFTLIVRSHSLDFDIKLSFNLKIESCEDINDFILCEYSFDSHIMNKIIHEDDKITAFISWYKKQITNIRMNKIKKLLWLNSLFSEYLLFHLFFLNAELTDWFQLLFCFLFSFLCEFMKSDFQSYLLNIFDIINIEMI